MQGFMLVSIHQISLLPLPVFHVFFYPLSPLGFFSLCALMQLCNSTKCMESIKCLQVCSVYVLIEIAPDCVCLSDSPLIWYQPPAVRCGRSVIAVAQ